MRGTGLVPLVHDTERKGGGTGLVALVHGEEGGVGGLGCSARQGAARSRGCAVTEAACRKPWVRRSGKGEWGGLGLRERGGWGMGRALGGAAGGQA